MDNKELVKNIIKDPINTLKTLNKKQIINLLEEFDTAFFNTGDTLVNDDIYDIVKEYLRKLDPKNAYFKRVGADEEHKVKLPFWLGSQDKIKDDEKEINKWVKKYPGQCVISEKLDGISCLVHYINKEIKIYTRGNGVEGQDISHIKDYIIGIIEIPKENYEYAVRGELIISRENWKKISHLGANARNVVAGAIHSKIINKEIMSNIEFVVYDVLKPRKKLSESLNDTRILNFKTVKHIIVDNISIDMLSTMLQEWRKISLYDIDGIVITQNEVHNIIKGKNPKYSFAFKSILTHDKAEVIVNEVIWNVSKDNYLKPIIKFNEVVVNDVKIKQATGFNGKFIETNKIGPGSRIIIIRSGDVIPHVHAILTPSANNKGQMPLVEYIWSDNHVDIILKHEGKNREQDIKTFIYFMKTLGISNLGEGIITKIYDAGYDTLLKIINIKVEDLLKLEGFKEKMANKIVGSLKEIKNTDCDILMAGSNIFGRGFAIKKIKLIIDKYPFIVDNKKKALTLTIENLKEVEGIAEISAKQFIENLPKYYEFYESLGFKCKKVKEDVDESVAKKSANSKIKGKKFVFTGFRNKDYEQYIIDNEGTISTTISKNVSYLIVKSKDDDSGKIKKANELNIPILSKEEFEKLLFI